MTLTNQVLKSLLINLLVCSSLILLSGCSRPTYPANRVIHSVKELCKDEYNLDVEVEVLGTTLGVVIPIEGLVDEDLKLDEKAAEKIEDVALSMRRVVLSTDRPIDFYIVSAQDTKMTGAEYVMTSCTQDVKRIMVLDISRGEYFSRIQRDFRLNPQVWGEVQVKNLFRDLNAKVVPESALANFVDFAVSTQKAQEVFYPTVLIARPQSINYQILELQSKEIAYNEALFWVKVKEVYHPKPGAEKAVSLFPPGFVNEYLIRLRTNLTSPIIEIAPKFFAQGDTVMQRNMQQIFERNEDLGIWGRDGLPKKEVTLKEFLAKQIARRLKEKLTDGEPFKGNFQVGTITAKFEEQILKLEFDIEGKEEQIFEQALMMVGQLSRRYELTDFTSVEITAKKTGKKLTRNKSALPH